VVGDLADCLLGRVGQVIVVADRDRARVVIESGEHRVAILSFAQRLIEDGVMACIVKPAEMRLAGIGRRCGSGGRCRQ
jgi:hypothetical protein